jgi:PAS domain-containing protein
VGQTYPIDDIMVTMQNRATAALYNYTPHLHGNQNFFRLWHRYFSQQYPDGTLLKTATAPDVWLVEGGFRRRFSSWTALVTRFRPELIVEVPQSVLDQFEPGREIAFPQYAVLRDSTSGKIYLYANDTKRYMNAETFRILGFNPEEVEDVPAADLAAVPNGADIKLQEAYPLGAVVRAPTKELYLVQDGVKHRILDDVLLKFMFAGKKIRTDTAAKIAKYKSGDPVLLPDGTLARSMAEPAVYVISHGQRRPFTSGEIFEQLGYSWSNVHVFNQALIDAHPLGQGVAKVEPVAEEVLVAPAASPFPATVPAQQYVPVIHPGALPVFPPLQTN